MADVTLGEFAEAQIAPRRKCWYRRLTEEQQTKVNAAKDAGFSNSTISNVLGRWEIKVTPSAVARHFGRSCACWVS